MDKHAATARFVGDAAPRLTVALGEPTLCGTLVESDAEGRALSIAPFRRGGRLSRINPD
jgi:calcineurin-like phosphoesterase